MDFRTHVAVKEFNIRISHSDTIMLLGSCFADEIGTRFIENKFNASVNPFGVLYNPLSIAVALKRLISGEAYSEQELFVDGNLYHSFQHHSTFSDTDPMRMLSVMNSYLARASQMLKSAKFLFLTFGTAWVYELVTTGVVVSNCHKLPASDFLRRRASMEEMIELWMELIPLLININPNIKVLVTVSPVRHLRDGAHENTLSKSELLLFCDRLQQKFRERILYFPAYEIVLDELRDYRFYCEDMTHPSEQAVSYVWERLSEVAFDDETKGLIAEWQKIRRRLLHRQLTCDKGGYLAFLQQTVEKLNEFALKYNSPDLSLERSRIEVMIKNIE
ncbi:MAG: GSCFA domain-containing protein [Bacteroidales bacterium]